MEVLPRDCLFECLQRVPRSSLWDCSMVNKVFREVCLGRTIKSYPGSTSIDRTEPLNEVAQRMREPDPFLMKLVMERDLLSLFYLPKEHMRKIGSYNYLFALSSQPREVDDPRQLIQCISYIVKELTYEQIYNRDKLIIRQNSDSLNYVYWRLMGVPPTASSPRAYKAGNGELIEWLNRLKVTLPKYKILSFIEACRNGDPNSIKAFIKSGIKPNGCCIQAVIKKGKLELLSILIPNQEYNLFGSVLNKRDTYIFIEWALLGDVPIEVIKAWLIEVRDKIYLLNMASLKGNIRLVKLLFELGVNKYKMVLNRAINKKNHELIDYMKTISYNL